MAQGEDRPHDGYSDQMMDTPTDMDIAVNLDDKIESLLQRAGDEAARRQHLEPRDVSAISWAMATLGVEHANWLRRAHASLRPPPNDIGGQALANTCWALSTLSHKEFGETAQHVARFAKNVLNYFLKFYFAFSFSPCVRCRALAGQTEKWIAWVEAWTGGARSWSRFLSG